MAARKRRKRRPKKEFLLLRKFGKNWIPVQFSHSKEFIKESRKNWKSDGIETKVVEVKD